MDIILLSNSVKDLKISKVSTSSELFELQLAVSLSKLENVNVKILSLRSYKDEKKNGLSLYSITKKNLTNKIKLLNNNVAENSPKIIIFFGYDYFTINKLLKIREKLGYKIISYTFDTHKAALEFSKIFKRILANFYFSLGIKKLNKLDGIILLNEKAYKALKLKKIPYLISKVGIEKNKISTTVYNRKNEHFKIVYAGSLTSYNGIIEIIEAFRYIKFDLIYLEIFGEGPLKQKIIELTKGDPRIKYMGLLSNEELNHKTKDADLLINARKTEHIVNTYSFPSKLVQYLASGIPTLSTKVIQNDGFIDSVFILEDLKPKTISEKLVDIYNNPEIQIQKSHNAKKFVATNYSWKEISNEMYNYFRSLE